MDGKEKIQSLNNNQSIFDLFEIRESPAIHGFGLFATREIKPNTPLLELCSGSPISSADLKKIPKNFCERVAMLGVRILFYAMNHSCNPNCWWDSRACLVSRNLIPKDSELTYDYATLELGYNWKSPWECCCGELICRRKISDRDLFDPELYLTYQGHLPEWVESEVQKQQQVSKQAIKEVIC